MKLDTREIFSSFIGWHRDFLDPRIERGKLSIDECAPKTFRTERKNAHFRIEWSGNGFEEFFNCSRPHCPSNNELNWFKKTSENMSTEEREGKLNGRGKKYFSPNLISRVNLISGNISMPETPMEGRKKR